MLSPIARGHADAWSAGRGIGFPFLFLPVCVFRGYDSVSTPSGIMDRSYGVVW